MLSASQLLQLQGKQTQRASDLYRFRMGISGATSIKSWTSDPLTVLFPIHLPLHNTQCTDSKSITSLSQNKLLVNLHATVVSLAACRPHLPCCCSVPASFSTDADPPGVGTGVRWLSSADLSGHRVLFQCPHLLMDSQLELKVQALLGKLKLVTCASGLATFPSPEVPI